MSKKICEFSINFFRFNYFKKKCNIGISGGLGVAKNEVGKSNGIDLSKGGRTKNPHC